MRDMDSLGASVRLDSSRESGAGDLKSCSAREGDRRTSLSLKSLVRRGEEDRLGNRDHSSRAELEDSGRSSSRCEVAVDLRIAKGKQEVSSSLNESTFFLLPER